jgi:hypothetical protein
MKVNSTKSRGSYNNKTSIQFRLCPHNGRKLLTKNKFQSKQKQNMVNAPYVATCAVVKENSWRWPVTRETTRRLVPAKGRQSVLSGQAGQLVMDDEQAETPARALHALGARHVTHFRACAQVASCLCPPLSWSTFWLITCGRLGGLLERNYTYLNSEG